MNKKYLFPVLLFGVGAFAVTGCSKEVINQGIETPWIGEIRNIYSCDNFVNLNVGETKQLSVLITPSNAKRAKVNYYIEGGDEAVATVSSTGLVTAKKAGKIFVVCESATNSEINFKIPVEVFNKCSYNEALAEATAQHLSKCNDKGEVVVFPDTFEVRERRIFSHSVNGKRFDGYDENCNYNISFSEAYVSFGGYEEQVYCTDGAREGSEYRWDLMTDDNYITYAYHIMGNEKNRVTLSTQVWKDDPTKTRMDVVSRIIDTMFRNGSKVLITQNYETACADETFDDLTSWKKYIVSTSVNDDTYIYTLTQNGISNVCDRDTADNTGIPEGTPYITNITIINSVTEGFAATQYVNQEYVYELNGNSYSYLIELYDAFYYDDDVSYVAPVDKEYSEVNELFDL